MLWCARLGRILGFFEGICTTMSLSMVSCTLLLEGAWAALFTCSFWEWFLVLMRRQEAVISRTRFELVQC